jgi:hypothetical protein
MEITPVFPAANKKMRMVHEGIVIFCSISK